MDGIDPALEDVLRVRAKRELRKRMRGLRAALPRAVVAEKSLAVARAVAALEAWKNARAVALFSSMPDEVDTSELVRVARAEGKRVALPAVQDDSPALVFRAPFELDPEPTVSLAPGVWGILEPVASAPVVPPGELDLVVVPALAFDPRGHRLGYGRGYYDHTLPTMTRAVRVGVAFDFQLIAEVPTRPDDVPVHTVVTDRRSFRAGEEISPRVDRRETP